MSAEHDKAFEALLSAARGLGFVSDAAEAKLHEFVDEVLNDPRNDPVFVGEMNAGLAGLPSAVDEDRDGPGGLTTCECDNTHEANDTVCRWCWAYGRRKWNDPEVPLVHCKFCGKDAPAATAHLHQGSHVGNCCWDDRLKATE